MKAIVVGEKTGISEEARFLGGTLFAIGGIVGITAIVLCVGELIRGVKPRTVIRLIGSK